MPIEPILRDHLLTLWRLNAAARGIKPTMVSKYAYGDVDFFDNLDQQAKDDRRGKHRFGRKRASVTLRKFDDLMRYFEDKENWPEGKMPRLPQITLSIEQPQTNGRKNPPAHYPRR